LVLELVVELVMKLVMKGKFDGFMKIENDRIIWELKPVAVLANKLGINFDRRII